MPGELLTEKPASGADSEASGGEEQAADSAEVKAKKPEAPASKAVVGIIYPPPEVRNIVDKTADFVARNGPEFEERIRLNEAGNPKFNFLALHDPYHAYYEHKIKEIREGVAQEAAAAPPPLMQQTPAKALGMIAELEVPTVPPPEWQFNAEPPSISALELDIVKLTAQFVARNGAMFLDKLMMREQRNYQFDFLRKQHPLFSYFTKLVEQYSRILLPPRDLKGRLMEDVERPASILERSQHRFEWEQFQLKQRRRVEAEEEKERVEYAQIDWHSFVIVETINFRESEAGYLPPPIHSSQLAQRLLQQQKYERLDEGGEVQEIEMELEENEPDAAATENKEMEVTPSSPPPAAPRAPAPPPAPPTAQGQTLIRHGYNPKAAHGPATSSQPGQQQQQQQGGGGQTGSGNFLISPITGEKIPAEKMQEHMRYGLLDPRWREEQKKQVEEKKTQEEVFAEGMQIGTHLKYLAERRTDIFGMEETLIGRKIGEEEKRKKNIPSVQWDGHSGSAIAATRQAQSNISEQLSIIQKANEQAEKDQLGPKVVPPKPPSLHQPPKPPLLPPSSSTPTPLFPGTPPIINRPPEPRPPPQPHMMPPQPPRMPQSALLRLPNSAPPVPGMLGGGPPPHMGPPPQQPGMFQPHPPPPMHLPPGAPPPMMGGMPLLPPDMGPPAAKRPHTETDGLMPEQEFISKNPGPVTFKVQAPSVPERPEWKLAGQIISITLPISDPVSVIKAKISDELGMPSGKQKLQIGSIFIKDSNSLGFYNFTNQTVVSLGLKERGGRRK